MMTFMQAIARMEGFGLRSMDGHENIPMRHNNPGDICAGQWANAHGAVPGAPDPCCTGHRPSRYAYFPTVDDGWKALRALLTVHYAGMTVADALAKYAPATENNTAVYVRNVCVWTGLSATDVLTPELIG